MAVTDDIVATYRGPRRVMRRLLAGERHEARALTYLIAALVVIYIAQWPGLSRAAHFEPEVPLVQRMVASFLAVMALLPVVYLLAALGHLVARAFGGKGDFFGARIALFWALLAVSPLMLLQGMIAGFIGPGLQAGVVGGIVFVVFLWFWLSGLAVSESGAKS
ncbi:YIP1 family protein [Defluviimonas sp. D31]|uniref:YIP1 family protein n=1 Tax=Defluviimonas sp. D31 TaxID=3083253 RepID=UPI00296F7623|nr:YIP1 family protein [Defluviimonas sp. D31]MDW4548874.1 YIP1 family protein [Defluviimonas sp. D31]